MARKSLTNQTKAKMHRLRRTFTVLFLILSLISSFATAAHESSALRTQHIRLLQEDINSTNATNATVPNDDPAETNSTTPTAAPQKSPEVAPVPTPASPTTHEPTKKYVPESDDDEEEEGEGKSAFAKSVWIAVASILIVGLVCYFRDAITFFVGTVSDVLRLVCMSNNFVLTIHCLEGLHKHQSTRLSGLFKNVFSVHLWFSDFIQCWRWGQFGSNYL